ncbi:hypothetical protein P5V15_005633 [Pogonomyrmex californicus]
MFFKWNENSTLVFLNTYRKYPCLWNPYHVKYYDCLAKNEALKDIIKELNIPELNISDCLEQIKVIREKYGQEQIRVIKGFQLHKPYKSPFAWFPIIAEMLTKVIDDQNKLQNIMRSEKTIFPGILKNYINPYDKYKNIYCAQETKQETKDCKTKSRKNTKFTKTGNLNVLNHKSERENDAALLQSPSCDWEDTKPDRLNITSKKTYQQMKSLDTAVPKCFNLADKPYEDIHKAHHRTAENIYQERYNNIIPNPNFSNNLSSHTNYTENIFTTHTDCPQGACNYINQQKTPGAIIMSKPKFCTKGTQFSNERLFPERRTKQVGTNVKQYNKGIQNMICVSKTQADIQKCQRKLHDQEIQNTNCMSQSDCQAFHKYSSMREAKQVDTNIIECPASNVRDMIHIKTIEDSPPNFILITTNRNYVPLIQRDLLKDLTNDKCQKDTNDLYRDQKEAKKTRLTFDDKKLIENEVCFKETCSPDIMETIKHNTTVTKALLQHLEKVAQERVKTHSVTSLLSKKDNANSNSLKTTICEQISCKFANENTHSANSSTIELESLNCLPCLEKKEEDNVIAMFTKTFLRLMKQALVLNSKSVQKGCVRKENVIETFIVLSKIKECADEILKIYMLADCSKRQLLNKFCSRSKSKGKYLSKSNPNSAINSIQTQDVENATDQFTASYTNSKDVEVLYEPSTRIQDHNLSEDTDKEITANLENHEHIGLNVSQVSLHDVGTQYIPKQLQDTGVITEPGQDFERKISVATQNREPILIRVIKSNNGESILKLDKETCVRDAYVVWRTNIDKCSKNMYQKYSIREYYDELSHPGVSHICEKEVNCIDYRTSSLSNRIYRCKGCKSSLLHNCNWTNIRNFGLPSKQRTVSRIPLYVKSHKYTRRRTDLYRTSQSYV